MNYAASARLGWSDLLAFNAMKLPNCKEHPDANDKNLPCWTLRHDDLRRVTPEEMFLIIQSIPNLDPVISWLKNGCDPLEATKELQIYQDRIRAFLSS